MMASQHRSRSFVYLAVLLIVCLCLPISSGNRPVARAEELADRVVRSTQIPRRASQMSGELALRSSVSRVEVDRVDVTLTGNGFVPATLTIFEGSSVVWHNATSQAHVLQGTPQFQVFFPSSYYAKAAAPLDVSSVTSAASPAAATSIFSATLLPHSTFLYTFTEQIEIAVEVADSPQFQSRIIVKRRPVDIDVKIIQPEANGLRGDDLHVVAVVTSLYEVAQISASANGRSTVLEYRDPAYFDKAGQHPGWVGDLDLSGMQRGASQLTLQVEDVYGGMVQAQQPFIHDEKPQILISAPLDNSVATPVLDISATCVDDDPLGCTALRAIASRRDNTDPGSDTLLASGQSSVAAEADLSAYSGSKIWIHFQATDSAGQITEQKRFVFVEASPSLERVEDVGGPIWDIQPDRILFLDESGPTPILKIHQRLTGQDSAVAAIPGKTPQYGYLTPKGTIFVAQGADVLTAGVYDWRDNQLVSLGHPNSAISLAVKGSYAIWSGESDDPAIGVPVLRLRDLVSGTTTIVSTDAGNIDNDVAANGDVVYWTSYGVDAYNIYRYRQGSSSKITNDTVLWNTYPRTDGTTIVYRKTTPCCANPNSALMLYQTSEVTLTGSVPRELQPGQDYQVNNGWVAFTKPGTGGQSQVWLRDASGSQAQISFFGASSWIDALAPNGEVMFVSGSRMYLKKLGTPAAEIGSSLGRSFWQNGSWFIIIGRSVFQVR